MLFDVNPKVEKCVEGYENEVHSQEGQEDANQRPADRAQSSWCKGKIANRDKHQDHVKGNFIDDVLLRNERVFPLFFDDYICNHHEADDT